MTVKFMIYEKEFFIKLLTLYFNNHIISFTSIQELKTYLYCIIDSHRGILNERYLQRPADETYVPYTLLMWRGINLSLRIEYIARNNSPEPDGLPK